MAAVPFWLSNHRQPMGLLSCRTQALHCVLAQGLSRRAEPYGRAAGAARRALLPSFARHGACRGSPRARPVTASRVGRGWPQAPWQPSVARAVLCLDRHAFVLILACRSARHGLPCRLKSAVLWAMRGDCRGWRGHGHAGCPAPRRSIVHRTAVRPRSRVVFGFSRGAAEKKRLFVKGAPRGIYCRRFVPGQEKGCHHH